MKLLYEAKTYYLVAIFSPRQDNNLHALGLRQRIPSIHFILNQFIFSQSLLLPEDSSCGFILLLEVICKKSSNCERCEMPIDVFGYRQQKYFNYFVFKDVVKTFQLQ